jgi:uncharacterized protein with HEPN domain
MNRDLVTVKDIELAATTLMEFTHGFDWASFTADYKTQCACIQQIQVMGEAVKRLSKELRSQHPEIPWAAIAGMRDNLIHGYDNVDIEQVWKVASRQAPALLSLIIPLVQELSETQ